MSRPRVLVTREVFDDVLEYLARHFDVTPNQADTPLSPAALAQALADKEGALTTLSERVDAALLAQCPKL
ncbi:MAG: hypothetical protein NUV34_09980 [Sulfuricaulis sp.]|nr:hypothetical protein [Sulfuricaulis sp.]